MQWSARILHETSEFDVSTFLTLTYNSENLPWNGSLVKEHLQLWLKSFRKELGERRIKYFGCGEYGDDNNRPHYHLVLMGVGMKDEDLIRETWDKGFIYLRPLNFERIKYTVGYVLKKMYLKDSYGKRCPPFQVSSKGIGERYVERNAVQLMEKGFFRVGEAPNALSRYYKSKLGVDGEVWSERARVEAERKAEEQKARGMSELSIAREPARLRAQKARNWEAKAKTKKRH